MMDPVFANINKIIERDSKATTYKFALLRGVIEIIQDHSPYTLITPEKVTIPTGLLIEKWLTYYYPVLESGIPQINGSSSLAFSDQLGEIIGAYRQNGGLSRFCIDIRGNGIPGFLRQTYTRLCRQMYLTITGMPMKHIGYSIYNRHYAVFSYVPSAFRVSDQKGTGLDFLIFNFGTFSIPRDYYDAFSILGSFINGKDWSDHSTCSHPSYSKVSWRCCAPAGRRERGYSHYERVLAGSGYDLAFLLYMMLIYAKTMAIC